MTADMIPLGQTNYMSRICFKGIASCHPSVLMKL